MRAKHSIFITKSLSRRMFTVFSGSFDHKLPRRRSERLEISCDFINANKHYGPSSKLPMDFLKKYVFIQNV